MNKKELSTQDKVILAAQKIFGEKGYHASTTKEISEEAGLSEGTIFRYFKTKKDLLIGVVAPVIEKTAENLIKANEENDINTVLENIAKNRLKYFKKVFPVMKIILFEGQIDNTFRQKVFQEITHVVVKRLEKLFEKKIAQGELKEVDVNTLAKTFMSFVIGMAIVNEISKEDFFLPEGAEAFIPKAIDIFAKGIKK